MSFLTHPRFLADVSVAGDGISPLKWAQPLVSAFRQWREERRLIAELSGLDDRELADLGLQRHDIAPLAKGTQVPATERRNKGR